MSESDKRQRRIDEKLSNIQLTDPWHLTTNKDSRILDALNPDVDEFKWDIKKEEIRLPSSLDELKYIFADVLAGDKDAANRPEYTCLNVPQIMKAIDWLLNNGDVSDFTRQKLAAEPWALVFKGKPPTMEEFLVDKYVGDIANTMYAPVKKSLVEFWDPLKPYRTLVLEPHIGWGKSYALILSYLFNSTHFGLMYNPHNFFGLSVASIFTSVLCAATKTKASELLWEPFLQILEQAPFFTKVRTHNDMLKEEQAFRDKGYNDHIPWTTSSPSSQVQFAGGNNYKLISSPSGLLGQTILIGGITEIGFFMETPGWNEEKVFKFFSKVRGRISSRMKGNYYGRFIIDSSPNSLEDPITQWAFEEAPKSKLNYVVTGSRWKHFPQDYPKFMKKIDNEYIEDHAGGFPLFKGGNGKLPGIVEIEDQLSAYDPVDIIWCPNESITASGVESYREMAKENPIEFIRDYAGIPSNAADRIFYLPEIVEDCFANGLRNLYGSIRAPAMEDPEHLIWNAVHSQFFYKVFDKYQFYYHPEAPRALSVDQSETKDMASIAMSHVCFNPKVIDNITKQPRIEYVTDFTILINPKGGLVNLDAIKFFIMDLRALGNIRIKHVSFDGFEARSTKQYLLRHGVVVDYLSVDRDTKPYQTFIDSAFGGRWHCGKNIFTKNNMKSIYMAKRKSGSSKIDHMKGDLVYDYSGDWEKDRAGIYAKDALDAICGNVSLLETYSNEFPPLYAWDLDKSSGRTLETVHEQMTGALGKLGLVVDIPVDFNPRAAKKVLPLGVPKVVDVTIDYPTYSGGE